MRVVVRNLFSSYSVGIEVIFPGIPVWIVRSPLFDRFTGKGIRGFPVIDVIERKVDAEKDKVPEDLENPKPFYQPYPMRKIDLEQVRKKEPGKKGIKGEKEDSPDDPDPGKNLQKGLYIHTYPFLKG